MQSYSSVEYVLVAVALLVLTAGIFWIIKSNKREKEKTQARLQEIQDKLKELETKN